MNVNTSNTTANNAANQVNGKEVAPPPPVNPKGDMSGPDTFMKLLVAELKQQDPNDPMDSRQMVEQLATLSSVQKLSSIDDKLGSLNSGSLESATLQSAGLIGKKVTAKSNHLGLDALNSPSGKYQLQGEAKDVNVSILGADGNKVQAMALGAQKTGAQTFQWDGKGSDGRRMPNGTYTFQIDATDAAGKPVSANTQISGLVSEVSYQNGTPQVVIAGSSVSLADVTSIAQ